MYKKDFVDLEILINKVRDNEIRQYVEEAIGCYYAKSYRATIITIWIATVLDLYKKIEAIYSIFNDSGAKSILDNIEVCKTNNKASDWEKTILVDAKDKVKIINLEQYQRLKRIEEDRHKCAHPVTDEDGILYLPTAEEARAHIRNAVEILLSQNAIFGKNFADKIIQQIEGPYVGEEKESIQIQINKYLKNSNEIFRQNLVILLLKKINYLEITNVQEFWLKYNNTLNILFEYNEKDFHVIKDKLTDIINKVTDRHLPYLIKLLYCCTFMVEYVQDSIKDRIEQYTEKENNIEIILQTLHYSPKNFQKIINDYMNMPEWISGQRVYSVINQKLTLSYINKLNLIDTQDFTKLIESAVNIFLSAEDLNSADQYEVGILNLRQYLRKEDIKKLLEQSPKNYSQQYGSNQLSKSVYMFRNLYKESSKRFPELQSDWESFTQKDFLQDIEILQDEIQKTI